MEIATERITSIETAQGLRLFEDETEAARRAAIDALHAATAIYTASPVVDQLLDRLDWPQEGLRLVDPSCGDGMFIARALDRLLTSRPAGFLPGNLIEGWEIHPNACIEARSRVAAVFAQHGHAPGKAAALAQQMIINRDFLTDGPTHSVWDIVAGNPPYLRAANVPSLLREQYDATVPDCAKADLLYSFLERCSRTIRPNGRIGLVTADRWLFNAGAGRLRETLGARVALSHVERLDVTTAFYRPKHRRAGSPPRIHPVSIVLQEGTENGQQISKDPIYPGADLSSYAGLPTLGEFAQVRIAPWLGTHGVFVVDQITASRLPSEYLVPAIDTDDIVDGKLGTPTRWAIRTSPYEEPPPAILEHLEANLHRMAARGRQGKRWMPPESFHRMDLSQPSLIVPRIAKSPKAIRVPAGVLPINHNLSIVAGSVEQLRLVEEALASPLAAFWMADHAPRLENGYFSLTTTMLRKLPMANT
ncbi:MULTISPECIES: Eco57I restriction-modification methylase domain-containing protein [unclassified Burkholderia]|uniref:Eco57I restriction-modification methylase domain-containing protein n=1 Tax=unclassified Burkholderia TaxID=2613784 RepID=UPI002AAFB63F|nr:MULTISPECIES: N-6 DNA methylase [unclassified Burkholderia]